MSLLFAGHETSATSLAWLFERLVRHPGALARARADAAYLDAAIAETMRLRPVLPDASRHLAAPARVMGHDLPAGVTVVIPFTHVHRLAHRFPEPDAFRPERFLPGPPDAQAWIPFGGGTRRCLGGQFAMVEMAAIAGAVLDRTRLRPARAAAERQILEGITLVPERGAEVILEAR
jgi:cytochrome P450